MRDRPSTTGGGVALVTGASSGIGEALAEGLARRGRRLILTARRVDRLEELASRLRAQFASDVRVMPSDLADPAERAALVRRLDGEQIDVACLNAGYATYGGFVDLEAEREREQVQVNVLAVHDLALALVPPMVRRGAGGVLVTGSTAGNQPSPNNATYAASKAFANTLAESLHGELAGTGVACTLLAPGPVRTEFADVSGLGRITELLPSFAWVSAAEAAEAGLEGLQRGRRRVVPGAVARIQGVAGQHLPRRLLSPALRKMYGDLR